MIQTVHSVIETCSKVFGVTKEDILSSGRKIEVVNARHCAMYVFYHLHFMGWSEIARIFKMDHSSVMSAVRKFDGYMDVNKNLLSKYQVVKSITDIPKET